MHSAEKDNTVARPPAETDMIFSAVMPRIVNIFPAMYSRSMTNANTKQNIPVPPTDVAVNWAIRNRNTNPARYKVKNLLPENFLELANIPIVVVISATSETTCK